MFRPLTTCLVMLVFAGSLLTADAQVKDKDKDKKADAKGMKAKITKVDAAKNVISVTTDAGKKMDVLVGKDTKFIGPKGGVSADGIKEDRGAGVPAPGFFFFARCDGEVRIFVASGCPNPLQKGRQVWQDVILGCLSRLQ